MTPEIDRRLRELLVLVQKPPYVDITPVFARDPEAFRAVVDDMSAPFAEAAPTHIVCAESMGYVFGVPIAARFEVGFVLARKGGRLPQEVIGRDYDVVYAKGRRIEITRDALGAGDRVLIVDDILAGGGTAAALVDLIESTGARVVGLSFFLEVNGLPGRAAIETAERPVHAALLWPLPE